MSMISVIIPVYNCEQYIKRCILSLKAQSYNDLEVIIIDDGSTDNTINVCLKAIQGDSRFIVLQKKNSGVSDTRNMGLDYARGECIAFVDADDWIGENYFEELVSEQLRTGADIVAAGYCRSDGINRFVKLSLPEKVLDRNKALDGFSKYYFTSVWGKLFKKEVIENIRFRTDIYYSEDTLFYTKAVINSDKVAWISNASYYYFDNLYGAMRKKDPKRYYSEFLARKEIVELQKENGIDSLGVEYWYYEAAVNVKMNLYRNKLYTDQCLNELNSVIRNGRIRFIQKYNTLVKSILLESVILFKLFSFLENKRGRN